MTAAGIVAGIACIMILGGYYEYNYWGLRESLIRSQYAHIQLTVPGFWTNQVESPFAYTIPRWREAVDWLDKQDEVDTVSPLLTYWAVVDVPGRASTLVNVRGVIPERENIVNSFFTRKSGQDLFSDDKAKAELGFELAKSLGLVVGSSFYLTTVDANGVQNALPFQVKGIVGSYSQEFDKTALRLPLSEAIALSSAAGVQQINILLKRTEDTQSFKARLSRDLAKMGFALQVTSWDEHAGYYAQVVQFYGGYFKIILLIIVIVVFFSTLNTMLMAAFERISEMGTLRSFGSTRKRIVWLFLCEGLILGAIGTLSGLAASLGIAGCINLLGGIPMPAPPGLAASVDVKIMLTWSNALIAAGVGMAVPLLATLIPALKTSSMTIIDQIRR